MFNPKPKDDPEFSFPLQCIWLKLNGSWPLDEKKTSRRYSFTAFYHIWSWYVIFCVGITIYFQTNYLIYTFGDIMKTTENCCTTFMGALNFVRLLHLRLNQQPFKVLIERFVRDIWIVKNSNRRIEQECQRSMRTFSMMSILLACLILMYCVLPLVELFRLYWEASNETPENPFPYKMMFFYDAHHGWRYVLTYIFTASAGVYVVTTLFAEDSLFGFFVTYTCGQFRILHEDIGRIMPEGYLHILHKYGAGANVPEWRFQREYTRRLHAVAERHSNLIEFSKILENFNSPILLVNFTISSILICMVGFQLVTGKLFIGDYVKFLLYIFSALSQLYILCWNGDTLMKNSMETAWHLYACNWEGGQVLQHRTSTAKIEDNKSPLKEESTSWFRLTQCEQDYVEYCPAEIDFRHKLQLMIMRSQRPVKLTALKFSNLSLQSFSKILSTSLSYFTLLQTLLEE